MRGRPAPDAARLQRDAQTRLPIVRLQFSWIEDMFADGRAFITGAAPALLDFTLYHGYWFLDALQRKGGHIVDEFPKTKAWTQRIKAIGHGTRQEMPAAQALQIARDVEPAAPPPSSPMEGDPALGSKVAIRPEDYGLEWVEGELVYADAEQLALKRHDAQVGEVVVLVPRSRYVVKSL
jgi:hypothetical protein